jgi:hypothetical protein
MLTTQQINSELKIVKMDTQKFKTVDGYYQPKGFSFKHPVLGYLSFTNSEHSDAPYTPRGGKKALQQILNDGGLLNFDNAKWLQEM